MINKPNIEDQRTLRLHRQDGAALAMVLFFVIVTSLWMMAVITLTQSSSSAIAQNTELSKVRSEVLSTGTEKALIALTKTEGESGCVTEDPDNQTAPCRFGTFINKCSDSARFSIPEFSVAGVTYEVKCAESSTSGYEYDSTGLYLMGPFLGESGGWNLDQDCSGTNTCFTGRDGGLRFVTSGGGYSTEPICASSDENVRFTVAGNIVNLFGRWRDVDCTNFEVKRPANLPAGRSVGIYTPFYTPPPSDSTLCPTQSGVFPDVLNCIEPNALKWGGMLATSTKPKVGKPYSLSSDQLNRAYAVEKSSVLTSAQSSPKLVSSSATVSNVTISAGITTGKIAFSPGDLMRNPHSGIQLQVQQGNINSTNKVQIVSGSKASGFEFKLLAGSISNGATGTVTTEQATFEVENPSCTSSGPGSGFVTDLVRGMKYIRVYAGELTSVELDIINELIDSSRSKCGNGENGPALIFDKGTYRFTGSSSKPRSDLNSVNLRNENLIVWGGDFDLYRNSLPASQKRVFDGNPSCPSPSSAGQDNVSGVKFEMSGYSYWWLQQGRLVLCATSKKVNFDSLPIVDSVFVAPRSQSYEKFNSQRHFIWGGGSRKVDCSPSSGEGDCPIIELDQGSASGSSCSAVKNCLYIGGQIVAPGSWIDLDVNGSTVAVVEGGLMVRALTVSTTGSVLPLTTVTANRWEYFGNRRVQLWFREKGSSGRYLGSLQLEIIDTKTQLASGYRVLAWRTGW